MQQKKENILKPADVSWERKPILVANVIGENVFRMKNLAASCSVSDMNVTLSRILSPISKCSTDTKQIAQTKSKSPQKQIDTQWHH